MSNTSAKSEEARRVAQTLREIEEDRDLVKRRVERERAARDAREKAQKEAEEKEKLKGDEESAPSASRAPTYSGGMDGGGGRGSGKRDKWKGGRTLDGRDERMDDGLDGTSGVKEGNRYEDEEDGMADSDSDSDGMEQDEEDERMLRQRRPHGASTYSGEGRRLGGGDDDVVKTEQGEVKAEPM